VFISNLGKCKFKSTTGEENTDENREALVNNYLRRLEITGQGIGSVLKAVITDLLLAGEVFVILTRGGSIQLIPSERIGSAQMDSNRRENEVDGLVLNKYGQPIFYRLAAIEEGKINYEKGTYIAARDIIHISNTSRIGQLRGTPMLAAATESLEQLHLVTAAYTAKVKTSAALTGFITSNQPYSARWEGNEFDSEPMRSTYTKLYNGSILLLEQGESVETIQGGNVDGVDKFLIHLMSNACASVGITIENLVGWSNASFSSSTATRAVTNHRFNQLREYLEENFLRRLFRWRLFKYERTGELDESEPDSYENFALQWTTSPTLDRRKDAQTYEALLKNNLASYTRIFSELGLDFDQEAEQIIKDKQRLAELTNEANLTE
jgi:capsid protein